LERVTCPTKPNPAIPITSTTYTTSILRPPLPQNRRNGAVSCPVTVVLDGSHVQRYTSDGSASHKGRCHTMSDEHPHQSVFLPIIGIILLIPPIFHTVRWIVFCNRIATSHADRVAQSLAIYPVALRDARLLTRIDIIFSVGAIVAGVVGIIRLRAGLRILCVVVFLLGGLNTLWNLFSLM
jgi:hypothetical protein